ncbi:hypothetical protein [Scytonema sp. NUACC26]|uniref:hypothetical protein n=1 Tax=Scytonema sp. NUACC26 TaxID=3140176 RepID=UPI0034DC552E
METSLLNLSRIAAAGAGPNVSRIPILYKLPEQSTLLPLLNKVNLAINVMQTVQASADLIASGKTGIAKAKTGIKSASR